MAATALAAVTAVAVFPYPSMGTEVPDDATVAISASTPEEPVDTPAAPAENLDDDPVFRLILQEERPVAPVPSPLTQPAPAMSESARRLAESVDAGRPPMDLRDPSRMMSGRSTFADRISGREATERVATDAGNLLGKSPERWGPMCSSARRS